MLITIFIASIMFFNMQNMVIDGFLTLDDKARTTLIGAGAVDGIKLWGYRILRNNYNIISIHSNKSI